MSDSTKSKEEKKSIPTLGILEEDDEFEEFPVEGTYITSFAKVNYAEQIGMKRARTSWILNNGRQIGMMTTLMTNSP